MVCGEMEGCSCTARCTSSECSGVGGAHYGDRAGAGWPRPSLLPPSWRKCPSDGGQGTGGGGSWCHSIPCGRRATGTSLCCLISSFSPRESCADADLHTRSTSGGATIIVIDTVTPDRCAGGSFTLTQDSCMQTLNQLKCVHRRSLRLTTRVHGHKSIIYTLYSIRFTVCRPRAPEESSGRHRWGLGRHRLQEIPAHPGNTSSPSGTGNSWWRSLDTGYISPT